MLDDTINPTLDLTADDDVVRARWEACEEFSNDDSGSTVCAACRWLDDEHGTDAVVHHLRGPASPARRLAS
jgi:hypothetical protein